MNAPTTRLQALLAALTLGCEAPAPASSAADEPAAMMTRSAAPFAATSGTLDAASAASSAPAQPPPAEGPYLELALSAHPAAVVSIPPRTVDARPIVVATHGNFDRPEWQCEVLRGIAGRDAFILCPRGQQRRDSPSASDVRFTYADNTQLEAELHAGLDALRARFGSALADAPATYAGFSLGAIMGVTILTRNTRKGAFDRALFVEGGHDRIDAGKARALFEAGVRRVLFACGQAACLQGARARLPLLEKAGVQARAVGVSRAGHTYDGAVAAAVSAEWAWFSGP